MKEDFIDILQSLEERFDHHKYVILPKSKHEWIHLRVLAVFLTPYQTGSGRTRFNHELDTWPVWVDD